MVKFFLKNLKVEVKSDFKEEDYEKIGLGKFIETEMKVKKVKSGTDKSGTLKTYYKHKLSEQFLKNVQEGRTKWSEIKKNKHAEKLGRMLHEFIAKHNK